MSKGHVICIAEVSAPTFVTRDYDYHNGTWLRSHCGTHSIRVTIQQGILDETEAAWWCYTNGGQRRYYRWAAGEEAAFARTWSMLWAPTWEPSAHLQAKRKVLNSTSSLSPPCYALRPFSSSHETFQIIILDSSFFCNCKKEIWPKSGGSIPRPPLRKPAAVY